MAVNPASGPVFSGVDGSGPEGGPEQKSYTGAGPDWGVNNTVNWVKPKRNYDIRSMYGGKYATWSYGNSQLGNHTRDL